MKLLQVPNAPLIIAISGLIISKVPNVLLHKLGATTYTIAIILWAYEEITSGINWARKLLGLVVIFTVAYSLFNQL
ncbi:MAG: hypothetical protein WBB49_03565 [Microgenomates group bacterium]|mgnify:CR=1 FL=1|jgi:hypothetical protein|nr:MAG: hypothetical protein IPH70_02140 [Candidatus Roizmanbacteria bacterium]